MRKIVYTLLFIVISSAQLSAQNSFVFKYKISFKENLADKTDEAKNWIRKFAHTEDLNYIETENSVVLETVYEINHLIFTGKMAKVHYPVLTIKLEGKKPITEEAKARMEALRKSKEAERISAGK